MGSFLSTISSYFHTFGLILRVYRYLKRLKFTIFTPKKLFLPFLKNQAIPPGKNLELYPLSASSLSITA